jgi:glycosyltransferase involved in cell wall biosynthesis
MSDRHSAPGCVAVICGRLWGNAAVEHRARLEIEALLERNLPVRVLTQQAVDERAHDLWPALVELEPTVSLPSRMMARRTFTKQLSMAVATARFLAGAPGRAVATVVAHDEAAAVGSLWWRRTGSRLVYVCHTSPRPRGAGLPRRHRVPAQLVHEVFEWLALWRADLVVCPAPSSREFYAKRRPRGRTIALENPVDLERFTPNPAVERDIDVLYVGRLAAEKGPAVLLEALTRSAVARNTVMVGAGSERARLGELARRCPGVVGFPGVVAHEELPALFRRARLVVVPSFTEAAGMVPVEAMACGTPVVASRVGGLADTIADGENGWLVPPGDVDALAAVLDRLLSHPVELERVGRVARASVDRFDARTFGARMIEAYGRS